MTPDEVRRAAFGVTWWRGYVTADVDGLLERIAIQLEARQSPAVTIEQTKLRTTHRGYVIEEVDRLLDRLGGMPFEPDGPSVSSRAKRSGPEMAVRVLVGLGLLASVTGSILYRIEPRAQHGIWETLGLTGLAALVLWQTVLKLTSTTAFDSRFDVRYFLLGAVLFVGGFGGLVAHLNRLTLANTALWTLCGFVGGVFLSAEYRDYRLRKGKSRRMAAPSRARLDRSREGKHFRRS